MNTAAAFRWRPTLLNAALSDLVRFEDRLGLIANGFECGFSTCWPPASRLALDRFAEAWRSTGGAPRERLLAAFALARERFRAESPALLAEDADFPDDRPDATLLAAAIEGHMVHVAWLGGDRALLVRRGAIVATTRPHTLREHWRTQDPTVRTEQIPNVILRLLARDPDPPSIQSFASQPGDTLVLLGGPHFRGLDLADATVSAQLAPSASLAVAAESLAALAFENDDAPYSAIALATIA